MLGIALGTAIPVVLAMLFGVVNMTAAGQGEVAERTVAGLAYGMAAVLVLAFGPAWHAYRVCPSPMHAESGPFWGLMPGILIAGSLGPALKQVAGPLFDTVGQGITIGLIGLVAGPLAWEITYCTSARLGRPAHSSEHTTALVDKNASDFKNVLMDIRATFITNWQAAVLM